MVADAQRRTYTAGKVWVRLRVGVGKDDDLQWVSIAVFGKGAEAAGELKKGDRVYIEGGIKLDRWTGADGVERAGLSIAAWRCERTHLIGKNRPKGASNNKSKRTGKSRRPEHVLRRRNYVLTMGTTETTTRLGQLIRLLSSDQPGEAGAAAQALNRTLATAGLDIHDLAKVVEVGLQLPRTLDQRRRSAQLVCDACNRGGRWRLASISRRGPMMTFT